MGCPGACPIKSPEEAKQLDKALEKEPDTNKATKKFYVILAIIFVLFFAFVFLGIKWIYPEADENYPTIEYNGFELEKIGGLWHTDWVKDGKTYRISLRYNPQEVEEIPVFGAITKTFNQHDVYLSFDPTSDSQEFKYTALANSELSLSLITAFGKNPIASCIKNETEACIDRSIVTCENYNKSVIIVAPNGDPAVIMKDNCIILKGEGLDILKSVDKLLYTWYRIMYPLPIPLEKFIEQADIQLTENSTPVS
ncbi:hypothetical protein KY314_02635 [Candidatus Woesearchaeota archaeon]|nr:hypothetical protein [Candidatus Woesearchaeota archaeon]